MGKERAAKKFMYSQSCGAGEFLQIAKSVEGYISQRKR